MGIVDIAVADADAWGMTADGRSPKDIMTSCRSVIVIGIPLQKTITDTAPSVYYSHLYSTVNASLDNASERIALELGILGYDAVYIPRDGYKGIRGLRACMGSMFSHKQAAYYAGIGTYGMNGLILTENHGPRIRFSSVLTSAALPPDSPLRKELCIGCGKCASACPANAIADGRINRDVCLDRNEELGKHGISPCGRCMSACPIGNIKSAPPSERGLENMKRFVYRRNLYKTDNYRMNVKQRLSSPVNDAGLRILSLVVRVFKSHPLHHFLNALLNICPQETEEDQNIRACAGQDIFRLHPERGASACSTRETVFRALPPSLRTH